MKQEEGQSIHSIEQAVASDEMTRILEDTRRNHAINYDEDKRNNRFGPLTDPSEDPRRKSWRRKCSRCWWYQNLSKLAHKIEDGV